MAYERRIYNGAVKIVEQTDKKTGKSFVALDIASSGGYITQNPAEFKEMLATIPEALRHYKLNLSGYSLYLRDKTDWAHYKIPHKDMGDYVVSTNGFTAAQLEKIFKERDITCEAARFGKPKLYASPKGGAAKAPKAKNTERRFGK